MVLDVRSVLLLVDARGDKCGLGASAQLSRLERASDAANPFGGLGRHRVPQPGIGRRFVDCREKRCRHIDWFLHCGMVTPIACDGATGAVGTPLGCWRLHARASNAN